MKPRYEVREMGDKALNYHGVWDASLRKWATWNDSHTVPMRFIARVAAETTAKNLNNGIGKV